MSSGTTGHPRAASLTHRSVAITKLVCRFLTSPSQEPAVGSAMRLTKHDAVCCLFPCFGLVMGLLASFCHGSYVVFPSDCFDAEKTLDAVVQEKATVLLREPTMVFAELEALESSTIGTWD